MKSLTLIISLLLITISAAAQHGHQMPTKMSETTLEKGLGSVSHKVTTSKPEAQQFFNQGLAYIYAFNHEQAIKAFKRAAEIDPDLAMAYWGQALALGSNYNLEADSAALKDAYANLRKAIDLATRFQNATPPIQTKSIASSSHAITKPRWASFQKNTLTTSTPRRSTPRA